MSSYRWSFCYRCRPGDFYRTWFLVVVLFPPLGSATELSLDLTGQADLYDALTSILQSQGGKLVDLPAGVLRVDMSGRGPAGLTIPAGTIVRGNGTRIVGVNPNRSQVYFRLSDGVRLERLAFVWDRNSHPTHGSGAIMLGVGLSVVQMHDVQFEGAGEVQSNIVAGHFGLALWGCRDSTLEKVEIKWSTGGCYGLELLGCTNIRVLGAMIHHNSADGVKVHGNGELARPRSVTSMTVSSITTGWRICKGQRWGTPCMAPIFCSRVAAICSTTSKEGIFHCHPWQPGATDPRSSSADGLGRHRCDSFRRTVKR